VLRAAIEADPFVDELARVGAPVVHVCRVDASDDHLRPEAWPLFCAKW